MRYSPQQQTEVSGPLHAPAALTPEKGITASLDGPQSRSGSCGE
jgi:hypothetical protein